MMLAGFVARVGVSAQDIEDVEKIQEAVDASRLTGRDFAAAGIIFVASCALAWLLGLVASRTLRRFSSVPDYVDQLVGRSVSSLVVFIGLATSLERLGVDVGWFAVIVALVGVVIVLMIRPLVENGASALLLTTRPSFSLGDHIETNGYRGAVVAINARSTVLRTRDHRRVHIPNNDVLDGPIVVFTAYDARRSDLDLEIVYDADVDEVCDLLVGAAASVEGVVIEPAPTARVRGFGTGTVMLQLRWWHPGDLGADGVTLDGVAREVKRVLDAAGVEMPSPELIVRQPDQSAGASDG